MLASPTKLTSPGPFWLAITLMNTLELAGTTYSVICTIPLAVLTNTLVTLVLAGTTLTLVFYIIYCNMREMVAFRKQVKRALYETQARLSGNISDDELLQKFSERFTLTPGEIISKSSRAAHHFISLLTDISKEKFGAIFLNANNEVLHSEVLFEGSLTTSGIYPRELIKRVLELNAAAIIIGHNHPSGSVCPSRQDLKTTQIIRQACMTMEIKFHDHIIVGNGNWFSFQNAMML